jgi:FMN phosphatase YigB (HAD superfamily)
MKQTHITDVFFDLDHTLWDFDKNSEITLILFSKKSSISWNKIVYRKIRAHQPRVLETLSVW